MKNYKPARFRETAVRRAVTRSMASAEHLTCTIEGCGQPSVWMPTFFFHELGAPRLRDEVPAAGTIGVCGDHRSHPNLARWFSADLNPSGNRQLHEAFARMGKRAPDCDDVRIEWNPVPIPA